MPRATRSWRGYVKFYLEQDPLWIEAFVSWESRSRTSDPRSKLQRACKIKLGHSGSYLVHLVALLSLCIRNVQEALLLFSASTSSLAKDLDFLA